MLAVSVAIRLRQAFPYWTEVFETIESAVSRLNTQTIGFRVSNRSRTIGEIIEHMVEVFDRDVTQFILGEAVEHGDLSSMDGLLEAIRAQHRTIQVLLDSETTDFLDKKSRFMGHDRTHGDALWNVFLEQVHHRGQVFLSMGAAGVRPPEL